MFRWPIILNREEKPMDDISTLQLCADFLKAYLTNPTILTLFILLILAVGVSLRFKKIEGKTPLR
jgi:hypothetical protein